jgi:hypothetical protein
VSSEHPTVAERRTVMHCGDPYEDDLEAAEDELADDPVESLQQPLE